jgi:glycosyltransferase involved in cell wall biosynthesis
MRVHIVQHGLTGLRSHYYNETIAWREALAGAGLGWHCYANIALTDDHASQTGAIPAFRLPADPLLEPDPNLAKLSDFIEAAGSFAADCVRVLTPAAKPDDVVLIPYATDQEIFGAAQWLETIPESDRPRLAFIVHRPDFDWTIAEDRTRIDGDFAYWRYAGKRLAAATGHRHPFLGVRDERLATTIGTLTGLPATAVPMSTFTRTTHLGIPGEKDIDLGMVGEFREERGSKEIPALLVQAAARHPHLRFLIQGAGVSTRGVEAMAANQSRDRFLRTIARCRMLVLPYAPQRYRMRTSGIQSFATGFGVPVIVPNGTWMSDRIADGTSSGFVYNELTAGFLDAILTMPQQARDALQRLADAKAEPWRERNSTHTVLEQILGWFRARDSRTLPA